MPTGCGGHLFISGTKFASTADNANGADTWQLHRDPQNDPRYRRNPRFFCNSLRKPEIVVAVPVVRPEFSQRRHIDDVVPRRFVGQPDGNHLKLAGFPARRAGKSRAASARLITSSEETSIDMAVLALRLLA
jgi:hypothetical protein